MIKTWIKDINKPSLDDSNLASVAEVLEKLNHFRKFSRAGIDKLSTAQVDELIIEIEGYFNAWGYWVNQMPKEQDYFRATVNKRITQKNEHYLTKVSQLTGPPKQYLTKRGRSNGLDIPVFYCADSLKAAIFEAVPEIGDCMTISRWRLKSDAKVNFCHIFHPDVTAPTPNNKILFSEHMKSFLGHSPKLAGVASENLRFLTEEFIKPMDNIDPSNYLFSSLFTELMFKKVVNGERIHALCYPSTKIQNGQLNYALPDDLVHSFFKLEDIGFTKVKNIWPVSSPSYRKIDVDLEDILLTTDFDVASDKIGH